MAKINLNTVFAYDPKSKPKKLILEDIAIDNFPPPEVGLLTLYGFRDTLDIFRTLHAKFEKSGKTLGSIVIDVETDRYTTSRISMKNLQDVSVLPLDRMSRDVEDHFIQVLRGVYGRHKVAVPEAFISHNVFTTDRPDFVAEALQHQDFQHIAVAIFRVQNEKTPVARQLALLMNRAVVKNITCENFSLEIELPKKVRNLELPASDFRQPGKKHKQAA